MNAHPFPSPAIQQAAAAIDARSWELDGMRARLRPKRISEILCESPPDWLVRGILPAAGLGVVFGEPGCGKTFAALDMGMAVARGVPWFGRRVMRRGVVYIACEGRLGARLAAYCMHHGVMGAEMDSWFRVIDSPVNLLDKTGDLPALLENIADAEKEMPGGVGLVIVDTLNRAMPGGDENSVADMGAMIAAAKRIEVLTGALVVFIHHSGKDSAKGARGHSSLKGAADAEIEVTNAHGARTLTVIKLRDGESGLKVAFALEHVDLGPLSASDPEAGGDERHASCVVVLSAAEGKLENRKPPRGKNQRAVLGALRELVTDEGERLPETSRIPPGTRGVRVERAVERARTLFVAMDDKHKRERILDALNGLRDGGYIGICDPWIWGNV